MNSMNEFYNEANDYSNYSGDQLNNYSGDELNYFAQGGTDAPAQLLEPLNRTLTFNVTNPAAQPAQTATLFYGNNPGLTQPGTLTVTVQETGGGVDSHNIVRQESLANPFVIQGLRYFYPNTTQLANAFTIAQSDIQGKTTSYIWQPTNYQSPTNFNSLIIDSADFGVVVDGRTRIQVPVIAGGVDGVILTLLFTVKAKVITTNSIFGKGVKEVSNAFRSTGNSIADLQMANQRRIG